MSVTGILANIKDIDMATVSNYIGWAFSDTMVFIDELLYALFSKKKEPIMTQGPELVPFGTYVAENAELISPEIMNLSREAMEVYVDNMEADALNDNIILTDIALKPLYHLRRK